jgi:riboflavin transporter
MNLTTKKLAYLGIFAALSIVLEFYIHFPIIPAAPFLLYAPGDLPILFAAIIISPLAGLLVAASTSVLFALITGQGGPWGMLMHFLASGAFVLVASFIFNLMKKKGGNDIVHLILALALGALARTTIMVPANLLITPIYLKVNIDIVKNMIIPMIIPFNLIYSTINSVIFTAIYLPLKNTFPKFTK